MRNVLCAVLVICAFVASGCAPIAPTVRMIVEQRNPQGGVVRQFDVASSDTGPTGITVGRSDTIVATATAQWKDGLQGLWIEGSYDCRVVGAGGVPAGNFVLPAAGNAIPMNTTPTEFSFTGQFAVGPLCGSTMTLSLRAGARIASQPTNAPSTSWTQSAQITKN